MSSGLVLPSTFKGEVLVLLFEDGWTSNGETQFQPTFVLWWL